MNSTLTLTREWDKTFPQNAAVDHCKVTFHNRFGIELAADLYKPKNAAGKRAAVAVSGPFGAGKEQSSGLYAQELRSPFIHRRKRRHAALCRLARHQHRGLFRRGRLPVRAR